jgi:hypothetical protein
VAGQPVAPRYSGTSKAAVCRIFGLKRTTLIDFLAWIGWSAGSGEKNIDQLDRPPPRQFLRVVDLTQLQHVPLHHAPAADPRVLDNAPVAVLLAILLANFAAQEHDGRQLSAHWRR